MSEVEWSAAGRGAVTATRSNGDRLRVAQAPSYTPEFWVWEVLVLSESGCCEYLTELEDVPAMDALEHAEEVDLYADASGTDFDDCPNCKPAEYEHVVELDVECDKGGFNVCAAVVVVDSSLEAGLFAATASGMTLGDVIDHPGFEWFDSPHPADANIRAAHVDVRDI